MDTATKENETIAEEAALPDIKGFQEATLLDWQGKISSIIFLGGCNLRCGFCHSAKLALHPEKIRAISFSGIEKFLDEKRGWIDGVVVTGGEPTLDEKKLFNLLSALKKLNFPVKLDTNGTAPLVLSRLIEARLVDYIAMDIKAPFSEEAYARATASKVNVADIILSKDIILNSGIDHEFRTTVVPGAIDDAAVIEIAKAIAGAKRYYLQQFVPRDLIDTTLLKAKPYTPDDLKRMASLAHEHLPNVIIRNN